MLFKKKLLSVPFIYNTFQATLGKFGIAKLSLFAKYLPYTPGMKVLDLGCGPASSCMIFRPEDYLGIDTNENYNEIIIHARFKENTARQQQETLGVLGTNLIYSAFFHYNTPKKIIKYLYDNLEKDQIEINEDVDGLFSAVSKLPSLKGFSDLGLRPGLHIAHDLRGFSIIERGPKDADHLSLETPTASRYPLNL